MFHLFTNCMRTITSTFKLINFVYKQYLFYFEGLSFLLIISFTYFYLQQIIFHYMMFCINYSLMHIDGIDFIHTLKL